MLAVCALGTDCTDCGRSDPSMVNKVVAVYGDERAFSARFQDGTMRSWGHGDYGGDSYESCNNIHAHLSYNPTNPSSVAGCALHLTLSPLLPAPTLWMDLGRAMGLLPLAASQSSLCSPVLAPSEALGFDSRGGAAPTPWWRSCPTFTRL